MLTHGWTLRWDVQNQVHLSHGKPGDCPGLPQREIHASNTFVARASVSLSFLSRTHMLSFEEGSSTIYIVVHKSRLLMPQTETTHAHMHTLHHRRRVPIRPKGASDGHGNKARRSCRTRGKVCTALRFKCRPICLTAGLWARKCFPLCVISSGLLQKLSG